VLKLYNLYIKIYTLFNAGLAVTLPMVIAGCGGSSGASNGVGGVPLVIGPVSSGQPFLGTLSGLPPGSSGSGSELGGVGSGEVGAASPSGVITSVVITTPVVSPVTLQARPTDSVPGPLPILGAAATFGCSRRLRRRIKRGR
jgi:hypothetical protein